MTLQISGVSVRKYVVDSLVQMTGADRVAPKAVAKKEGVSHWAIYKRRARLEAKLGRRFDRDEKRGRKPAPLKTKPIDDPRLATPAGEPATDRALLLYEVLHQLA